ncbi:class I SAM-dependent methyltransferase [Patescibacteria group bacterium]
MNEYKGRSVRNYRQPSDKKYTLFPALDRQIPEANTDQTLLDLGCGTGDLYKFATSKGYKYVGLDASEDMVSEARRNHPQADFIVGDASEISKSTKEKFDVIMANMLFPSLPSIKAFNSVFESMSKSLKEGGLIILGIMNPYFDGYMQKRLFDRKDIDTDFDGYFKSGVNYTVRRVMEGRKFTFSDYHWQLPDYTKAARQMGLSLRTIDDCKPESGIAEEIPQKKFDIPNYMVLVLQFLARSVATSIH